jgi:hypothetical protein
MGRNTHYPFKSFGMQAQGLPIFDFGSDDAVSPMFMFYTWSDFDFEGSVLGFNAFLDGR